MIIGDNMNGNVEDNDLEKKILDLEKRVLKLERIHKMNVVLKVITIIVTIIILILFLYILGSYYNELLSSF